MPPTYLHFEPWQWEWTVHWVLHIYFSVVGDELKKSTPEFRKERQKDKNSVMKYVRYGERVRIQPIWDIPELKGKKKNLITRLVIDEIKKKMFKLKKGKVFT